MFSIISLLVVGVLTAESVFWWFTIERHGKWISEHPEYERVLATSPEVISFTSTVSCLLCVISWGWYCYYAASYTIGGYDTQKENHIFFFILVSWIQIAHIGMWSIVARYYCLPKIFWPIFSRFIHDVLVKANIFTDIAPYCVSFSKWKNLSASLDNDRMLLINFLDVTPDMIWVKDLKGRYTYVNKVVCTKLLHYPEENIIGKTIFEITEDTKNKGYAHTFGEICRKSDRLVLQRGKPQTFLECGIVNDEFMALYVLKSPIYKKIGIGKYEIIGTIGIGRDVTIEWEEHEVIEMYIKAQEWAKVAEVFEQHKNRSVYQTESDFLKGEESHEQ